MIRFRFKDQDFFEADPVRYARALGDRGIAAYRKAVDNATSHDSFAVCYARERLAILDRDVDAVVRLVGGDLSHGSQFLRVAQAMAELERPDLVLEWTGRGIEQTSDWNLGALFDLACRTHASAGQPVEVLRLRRAHHHRRPSSTTYHELRGAAEALDVWSSERDAARLVLRDNDIRGYVSALLDDGDGGLAWEAAANANVEAIGTELWLTLAANRERTQPADAIAVYQRVTDGILETADRRSYQRAARILKQARSVAQQAGGPDSEQFRSYLADLRETHRRRPTLIAILEGRAHRAQLSDGATVAGHEPRRAVALD